MYLGDVNYKEFFNLSLPGQKELLDKTFEKIKTDETKQQADVDAANKQLKDNAIVRQQYFQKIADIKAVQDVALKYNGLPIVVTYYPFAYYLSKSKYRKETMFRDVIQVFTTNADESQLNDISNVLPKYPGYSMGQLQGIIFSFQNGNSFNSLIPAKNISNAYYPVFAQPNYISVPLEKVDYYPNVVKTSNLYAQKTIDFQKALATGERFVSTSKPIMPF